MIKPKLLTIVFFTSLFIWMMIAAWFFSAISADAKITLRFDSNGGIELHFTPERKQYVPQPYQPHQYHRDGNKRVIPAPHRVDKDPGDGNMALQILAVALSENDPDARYFWSNPKTGNSGETVLYYRAGKAPKSCTVVEMVFDQYGTSQQRETMTACRGGGNSNTWIIDKQWVISSVTRTNPDHNGCRIRFVDAKIPEYPRGQSTMKVCHKHQFWFIQGDR